MPDRARERARREPGRGRGGVAIAGLGLALASALAWPPALGWAATAEPPVVSSAAEDDYPPFSVVTADGRADGFSVELMRAALAAMGREVVFRTGSWPEIRSWLERGEVEALPLVGRTPEREPLFDFTVPYMTLHGAIVVRQRDAEVIDDLEDLRGRHVLVMAADNAEEFLLRSDLGVTIHTTDSFEEALKLLAEGVHDAVIMQRLVALRLVDELGLVEELHVVNRPVMGFRQDFCFAVPEGDREMLALLNEGLALITADGTYRRLHAKWFATLELPPGRRVVVAGDRDFPPFEFLDADGRPTGFNVDLTRAVARAVDLDVVIRLDSWPRVRSRLEDGDVDALQGMFYSPDRDRLLDFTPPHSTVHYVAVVRADDAPAPGSLEEVSGQKLVVQSDDIMHDVLRERRLGGDVEAVDTQEEALAKVARGERDTALVARATALYCIEKHGWKNLVVGKRSLISPGYCYAVPEGHGALLTQLSEGLRVIEESGEYRRIYERWMGIYQRRHLTLTDALRRSTLILAPLLLVALLAVLWSWQLRRQVAARTAALRESERRMATLLGNLPGMAYRCRNERRWTMELVSEGCRALTGYDPDELVQNRVSAYGDLIVPDDRDDVFNQVQAAVASGDQFSLEYRLVTRSGEVRWVWEKGRSVTAPEDDSPAMLEGFITDVTDRRALEERLLQSQKMEAVGRLAGGVAHDYNNMLAVIIGNAEMARLSLEPGAPAREDIDEILAAARRSVAITQQLLGFARKQTAAPRRLDVNEAVESLLSMMRSLLGEGVDLSWRPGDALWPVRIDPAQLDQVVANLCVNARDAVAGMGRVLVETANVSTDARHGAEHPGLLPGDFVLLAVSDDGAGMDRETLAHMFEPFFSTKEGGLGTGLGLATVYGIVEQNGGFISVDSEPTKGTTVKVYLARDELSSDAEAPAADLPHEDGAARGETVLIVEDEPSVLRVAQRALEDLGYAVLTAAGPTDALELAESHAGPVDLLVTDVVMPGMDGRALAQKLAGRFPSLRILFMSGYTADVIARRGVLEDDVSFLQKPFTLSELARKVRETLNAD